MSPHCQNWVKAVFPEPLCSSLGLGFTCPFKHDLSDSFLSAAFLGPRAGKLSFITVVGRRPLSTCSMIYGWGRLFLSAPEVYILSAVNVILG